MMGFGYISKQVYTFQNYDELLKILQITKASNYQIDTNEKIIEYTIDRKQWIRLNDLMEWIQTKFIRFHIGQLLDLFEQLLVYVLYLQQQNIDHLYLDSNRIWLVLKRDSQYPNIIHQNLLYDIVFTGYQCPLYETPNIKEKEAQQKIQNIILEIVQQFIRQKVGLIYTDGQIQEEKQIFTNLQITLEKGQIQNTLHLILSIKSQFSYNNKTQMVSFDKETAMLFSKRRFRINDVKTSFEQYIKQFNQYNEQLIVEEGIKRLITLYMLKLDEAGIYTIPQASLEIFIREIQQNQLLQEIKLKNMIEQIFKEQIENLIKSQNKFIFDYTEDKIKIMEEEFFKVIKSRKIFLYFKNSNYYGLKRDQFENKLTVVSDKILQVIKERFILFQYLEVCELSQEIL